MSATTTAPGWRAQWRQVVDDYDVGWVLVDAEPAGLGDALGDDPAWSAPPGAGPTGVTDGTPGRDAIVLLRRRAAPESAVSGSTAP